MTTKKKTGAKTSSKKKSTPPRKATAKKAKTSAKKKASKKSTTAKKAAKKTAKKSAAKKKNTSKKSTAKKSTAKKATVKKAAKKATKAKAAETTKKKATAKKATAKKKTTAKSAAKAVEKPKPALKKAATVKASATASEIMLPEPTGAAALTTDELWQSYRKEANRSAGKPTPKLEELRNVLIERHYPLVRYIAERLLQTLPRSIELDDLISAGLFGLMDAIRGFDASRGIKFKTYCSTRIRGSILDQLRSQDWVPRLVRLKAGKIEKALQKLIGIYGREPTHAELAKQLEMEHGDLVNEIQNARAKTMFSLSEKWEDGDDDGSAEKVEILEDKQAVDPVAELNRSDLMGYITRSLTQKEKFIIERYYKDGHTMREIGELLSLTESRVCQIHSNVMGRLKNLLSLKEESLIV